MTSQLTNLTAWYAPVNVHPHAMRFRAEGETRAVEPTEIGTRGRLLPVPNMPTPSPGQVLPYKLAFGNQVYIGLGDAHHYTALGFPA